MACPDFEADYAGEFEARIESSFHPNQTIHVPCPNNLTVRPAPTLAPI